ALPDEREIADQLLSLRRQRERVDDAGEGEGGLQLEGVAAIRGNDAVGSREMEPPARIRADEVVRDAIDSRRPERIREERISSAADSGAGDAGVGLRAGFEDAGKDVDRASLEKEPTLAVEGEGHAPERV